MLLYRHHGGKGGIEEAVAQLQAIVAAHTQIITQIDLLKASQRAQQPGKHVESQVHAQRGTLQYQGVLVAIHREAGQAVALSMHQAQARRHGIEALATLQGPDQTLTQQRLVYVLVHLACQDTHTNLRAAVKIAAPEKNAVVTVAIHYGAVVRLPRDAGNFTIVDPGMPLVLAPFAPSTQNYPWIHDAFFRPAVP